MSRRRPVMMLACRSYVLPRSKHSTPIFSNVPTLQNALRSCDADDALTVQRCDFKGYFRDDPDWFPQHPNGSDKQLTRWLPDGCVEEAGGVIAVNARDKGVDACTNTSFTFTTRIAARATGLHTFWVESDDGASLYIGGKKIVDNAGYHAPQWKKGSVYLRKGAKKTLQVYYGNANFQGMLNVMWEDTLTDAPQQSLLPIMV